MVPDGPRSPRARHHQLRLVLTVACATAAFVTAGGIAAGAVGDLTYVDCITGEEATGPAPGTGACAVIPSYTPNGANSGIDNPQATAVSPDGKSLYLASGNDAAVARFDRDTTTGALTYQGCITGKTESGPMPGGTGACVASPTLTPNGFNSGFDNLRSIAVSPDGTSVYAVSGFDDSILRFSRDTTTGALTYHGCITGETESDASAACVPIPDDQPNGTDSGLDFLTSVAVSPDGTSVYAGSSGDDSVVRFGRDPSTGVLSFQACVSGEGETGPTGTNACFQSADAAPLGGFGDNSGLNDVVSIALSPDSEFLYAVAANDDSVARFDRDTATGAITYQGCTTGETEAANPGTGQCAPIPATVSLGAQTGLDNPIALTISAGGGSLYVASHDDDAIARFTRDPATGGLTYEGCVTGEDGSGPAPGSGACTAITGANPNGFESGLDQLYSLTTSADGRSVYAVSQGDDAVVAFTRDPASGAITFRGCTTGEQESGPAPGSGACVLAPRVTPGGNNSGLEKPRSLAVTADNKSLYATSPADDAVNRFGRELEPAPVTPTPPGEDEVCFGITIDGSSITGDGKNNKLNGTALSDQLRGGGGNDKVRGDDGADCLFGNADKDKVKGQNGDDVVRGGSGNDKLSGGKDDDTIRAQDGDDKVNGGSGDDSIKAQARGIDKINCGAGNDSVVGDIKDTISPNCEKVRIVDPR